MKPRNNPNNSNKKSTDKLLTVAELDEQFSKIEKSANQKIEAIDSIAEEFYKKIAALKKNASNTPSFFKDNTSHSSSDTDEDESPKPTLK